MLVKCWLLIDIRCQVYCRFVKLLKKQEYLQHYKLLFFEVASCDLKKDKINLKLSSRNLRPPNKLKKSSKVAICDLREIN